MILKMIASELCPRRAFFVMCVAGLMSILPWSSVAAQHKPVPVHPFEQPPLMEETTPNATVMQFLQLQVAAPGYACHPKGSVRRVGNDVYVTLNLVRATFTINNPDADDPYGGDDPVELRSYGGCHAGPTLEVLPGNTLHVNLVNSLSADDPSCLSPRPPSVGLPPGVTGVGCFNTTNLHTHGLHVSPAGNSDNVLIDVAPQTEFPYEINIPSDHPAGTFWYHAHRHGSTAMGVASGASGILVIRGTRRYAAPTPTHPQQQADIDTVLHDSRGKRFREKLFLFQQIPYACFSNPPGASGGPWQEIFTWSKEGNGLYDANSDSSDENGPANARWKCPKPDATNFASIGVIENFGLQLFSSTIWDTNGRFTSINGIVQPTITIRAGEIERWRFLHAGIHDTINLQVVRAVKTNNVIADSALAGDRVEQKATLKEACSSPEKNTLIPQFEIAVDGLTRKQIRKIGFDAEAPSNYLQPGYRSDVLMVFPKDGDYCLMDQPAPPSERAQAGKGGQGPSYPQLLAYIHVRGGKPVPGNLERYVEQTLAEANLDLPVRVREQLGSGDISPWAPFLELPPPPAANLEKAAFAIAFPKFQINQQSYDPEVINVTRQVNTSDDWILSVGGKTPEPHIFHIHVNPFEIIDVTRSDDRGNQISIFDKDGRCRKEDPDPQGLENQYCGMYHVFRDTVFVENGYQVRARTYYDRYIGEFVIHCHILDHEDAGMMLNINIVPNLNSQTNGKGMAGMHHDP